MPNGRPTPPQPQSPSRPMPAPRPARTYAGKRRPARRRRQTRAAWQHETARPAWPYGPFGRAERAVRSSRRADASSHLAARHLAEAQPATAADTETPGPTGSNRRPGAHWARHGTLRTTARHSPAARPPTRPRQPTGTSPPARGSIPPHCRQQPRGATVSAYSGDNSHGNTAN